MSWVKTFYTLQVGGGGGGLVGVKCHKIFCCLPKFAFWEDKPCKIVFFWGLFPISHKHKRSKVKQ